jgi:hypothetical protein
LLVPRLIKEKDTGPDVPKNKKYLNFFNELRNNIIKRKPNFTKAKAMPQSWWSLSIGKSGFFRSGSIYNRWKLQGGILYIDTGTKENNDIAFSKLKENSLTIQDNIGKDLVWDPLPDRRACRIYLATNGTIDDDEKKLTELTEWAAPMVIKFKEVFSPLVKNIQIE